MALSKAERRLLLGIVKAKDTTWWNKIDDLLGTVWAMEDLVKEPTKGGAGALPAQVRLPVLLALVPELFQTMGEDYRKRASTRAMSQAPAGSIDIGTLPLDEAKALLLGLDRIPQASASELLDDKD